MTAFCILPQVKGCRIKRGLNTKIYVAVDVHGLPVKIIVAADSNQAGHLIQGISADDLIADRGYDSNEMVDLVESQDMKAAILSKK
jgi:transposase